MVREAAGGDIWTKDRYGDFVLELEFKTAGNSGVFIRTDNPKDNVQTGIEIQVDVPGRQAGQALGRGDLRPRRPDQGEHEEGRLEQDDDDREGRA